MRPLCGRFTATLRPLCGHFAVTRRRIRQLARPVSFQKVFVTGRRRRKKKAKKNSKRKQKKKEKRRRRRSRRRPKMDVAGRPGVIELVVEIPFDFSGSFVFLFVCFFHFSLSLSLSLSLFYQRGFPGFSRNSHGASHGRSLSSSFVCFFCLSFRPFSTSRRSFVLLFRPIG